MNHTRRGIGLEKKSMDYDSKDSELSKYKAKAAGTAQQLQGSWSIVPERHMPAAFTRQSLRDVRVQIWKLRNAKGTMT